MRTLTMIFRIALGVFMLFLFGQELGIENVGWAVTYLALGITNIYFAFDGSE